MQDRVESAPPGRTVWTVGYDGSENARHAALFAARHAEGRADELRLVTAWRAPFGAFPSGPLAMPPGMDEDLGAIAATRIEGLAESLRPSLDVPVTTATPCGGAAERLIDEAPDQGLIVVGTRGHGGFARLMLGSTSSQVATHADIPVVVVPPAAQLGPIGRIVVAVDGSPNSLAALDWALAFAPTGASIEGVMVWDVAPLAVGSDHYLVPEASGAGEARLEHLLATRAAHARTDVRSRFVEGNPRFELQRAAAEADLLVVGARGLGAIGAALLGSVSTWLLHHVDVATVVVPSTGLDDPDRAEIVLATDG